LIAQDTQLLHSLPSHTPHPILASLAITERERRVEREGKREEREEEELSSTASPTG